MDLQDQHINGLIILYEKHYGVVLEREVAMKKGLELCRLVEVASRSPDNERD